MHGMSDKAIHQQLVEQNCSSEVIAELLGTSQQLPVRTVAPFSDIVHRSPTVAERHNRPEPTTSAKDAALSESDMDEKIETFIADEIMSADQPAEASSVPVKVVAKIESQPTPPQVEPQTAPVETKTVPVTIQPAASPADTAVTVAPKTDPVPVAPQQAVVEAPVPPTLSTPSVNPDREQVETATPSPAASVIAATVSNPKAKPIHKRHFAKYAIGGVLVLLLVAIGGVFVFPREAPQATARPIAAPIAVHDQNYTLVLPASWRKGSDYVDGGGVNVFYQSSDTATKVSRMAVFVTPSNPSQEDHVSTQIAGLQQNGGTAHVNTKMPLTLGSSTGMLTDVTATSASNPNDITHYLYLACTYGNTDYNIDVLIPAEQWNGTHNAILTSLQSFRPTNKAITLAKPKTN